MKVAIFGASGLVGRSLRHLLTIQGIEWIGTYHTSAFEGGYFLEETDEESLHHFLERHQITHCINCVAERNVDLCEKQWDATHETNSMFAARLASVCRKSNLYFLHISTDYVFDGSSPPYSPSSPIHPIQAYGKSKALAERYIQDKNPNSCILRVPVLYTQRYKTILETAVTMIGKKVMDKTHVQKEDNYYIRRPVFIDDMCHFIIYLVKQNESGTYHFYNPSDKVTKYTMANKIGQYLETDTSHILPTVPSGEQAGRPFDTQLTDNQYNRHEFPFTSLEVGIQQCFERFKHPRLDFSTIPSESIFYMIDLDGTLVDTDKVHYDSYKKAFEQVGYSFCSWEDYQELLSVEEYCRSVLKEDYDRVKIQKNNFFFSSPSIEFIPGAEDFLTWILKTKQNAVVVTNTSQQTVAFLQEKLPLLAQVTKWITREDVQSPKPNGEPYQVAKEKFWKGEAYILGIENTIAGYQSLKESTDIIYIVCAQNSITYKQIYNKDVYIIPNLKELESKVKK